MYIYIYIYNVLQFQGTDQVADSLEEPGERAVLGPQHPHHVEPASSVARPKHHRMDEVSIYNHNQERSMYLFINLSIS